MKKEQQTVVVGMSGGVDSSVAAYLLKKEGYRVIGVTMQMCKEAGEVPAEDAARIAAQLGIEHHVFSFQEEFEQHVMDYFVQEYENGRTPNPCNMCNRYVKWEALLNRSREFGADYVATGHYAKIDQLGNGRYSVRVSSTAAKDQTYALYNLTQEQLSHTLMPVGAYTKEQIRQIAEEQGLVVAQKPDSQEICFVPDQDYAGFITRRTGKQPVPGNFVTKEGNILGQHKGIIHYTVGQRKGLNLAMGYPVFVVEIRPETNEVVIGQGEDVWTQTLQADRMNWMGMAEPAIGEDVRCVAKVRYHHKGTPCTIRMIEPDRMECVFDEPVRAVTPGQAVVLYQDDYVLGGGSIL